MKNAKRHSKMSFHIDSETKSTFDWLKDQGYSVSTLLKILLREKVSELQRSKDGQNVDK